VSCFGAFQPCFLAWDDCHRPFFLGFSSDGGLNDTEAVFAKFCAVVPQKVAQVSSECGHHLVGVRVSEGMYICFSFKPWSLPHLCPYCGSLMRLHACLMYTLSI
jgi:hypothetical protein